VRALPSLVCLLAAALAACVSATESGGAAVAPAPSAVAPRGELALDAPLVVDLGAEAVACWTVRLPPDSLGVRAEVALAPPSVAVALVGPRGTDGAWPDLPAASCGESPDSAPCTAGPVSAAGGSEWLVVAYRDPAAAPAPPFDLVVRRDASVPRPEPSLLVRPEGVWGRTIVGVVTDERGPVAGAAVQLTDDAAVVPVVSYYTNSRGEFRFLRVHPDHWVRLKALKDGRWTNERELSGFTSDFVRQDLPFGRR